MKTDLVQSISMYIMYLKFYPQVVSYLSV